MELKMAGGVPERISRVMIWDNRKKIIEKADAR
jgi:hypothetical protein